MDLFTHSTLDSFLHSVIAAVDGEEYTVIYTTTPPSVSQDTEPQLREQLYEMDEPFPSMMHTDLKRDLSAHARNASSNLPLFEKYQFLSPGMSESVFVLELHVRPGLTLAGLLTWCIAGIFMALTVTLPLMAILYVGIRALTSLEVSYYAFSKEMGPTAQKKQ